LCLIAPLASRADGEACQKGQLFDSLRAQSDFFTSEGAHEVDHSLVFYRFAEELGTDAESITFEVRTIGGPFIVEEISLTENESATERVSLKKDASSGGSVVELLALYPAQRARLRRMADAGEELETTVRLQGHVVDILTYKEILARSAELLEDMPLPRAITSRLTVDGGLRVDPAADEPIHLKSTCEQDCYQEYGYCYGGCGGDEYCAQRCDSDLDECLDACTCEYSQNVYTSTQLVSITAVPGHSPRCLDPLSGPPWDDSAWYLYAEFKYRITTTTVTRYADCTSDSSNVVTYAYEYCYAYYSSGPCPSPSLSPTC
jgi:hypothetical protein